MSNPFILFFLFSFLALIFGYLAKSGSSGGGSRTSGRHSLSSRSYRSSRGRSRRKAKKLSSRRRKTRFSDPMDLPQFLGGKGWEKVHGSRVKTVYAGRYRANGRSRPGIIERFVSGRTNFLIKNPPRSFKRKTHGDGCLPRRKDYGRGWREVHFDIGPDAMGDGVQWIEKNLGG